MISLSPSSVRPGTLADPLDHFRLGIGILLDGFPTSGDKIELRPFVQLAIFGMRTQPIAKNKVAFDFS